MIGYPKACLPLVAFAAMAPGRALRASPRSQVPAVRIPAEQPPTVQHFATAALALAKVLETPARVVAFGEYHQTVRTARIPSSLARFSRDLLPVVARTATDLVAETWVADGRCGKRESTVVGQVQATTERPPQTENEVITLLERAKAAGVAPHILPMSCKDYRWVTGKNGDTDFARMLRLTKERLQSQVLRWLHAAPAEPGDRPRVVVVYGGALHNDLYPTPEDKPYAFGRALFAKTHGQYLEVDLFVPEYILHDKRMAAEPWFPLFKANLARADALLIRRSPRSYIIVFPRQR